MLKTGPHDQLILGLRAEGRIVRPISYQKANGNRWQPLSTLPPPPVLRELALLPLPGS